MRNALKNGDKGFAKTFYHKMDGLIILGHRQTLFNQSVNNFEWILIVLTRKLYSSIQVFHTMFNRINVDSLQFTNFFSWFSDCEAACTVTSNVAWNDFLTSSIFKSNEAGIGVKGPEVSLHVWHFVISTTLFSLILCNHKRIKSAI